MKKIKKYLYLIIFSIIVFGLFFPNNLKAQSARPNVYRDIWKNDSLINGFNQLENYFHIPENMEVSEFMISLKIKPSPTLIGDLSSISILVNNIPVYSMKVKGIDKSGLLNIKVPEHLLYRGRNSIVIKGFLKSTTDKCEINDDLNWIIIEKGSFFSFDFNRKDSEYIRDIFENTYYSDGLKGQVQIAVPDEMLDSNYSQLSSLSALMGYMHKDKEADVKVKTIKYSQLDNNNKETVVIGTPQQFKYFKKDLLTDNEWQDANKNGYIGIRRIGVKNHFLLMISDDSQLETLSNILQSESSLGQIKDVNYILDKSKVVNKQQFNTRPSLQELGYEDIYKVGNGVKEFNYYLTIPANKVLKSNNRFILLYNYSSLLNTDDAYVTVSINGKNLMSRELIRESNIGQLEFSIPDKYFDEIGFNISLKFNLNPEVDNCTEESYEDIWITVDSQNSYFDLDLDNRVEYSLLNAQGLFQDANGYIDGSIMVDNYENLSIDSISSFSSYLGRVSQGVNKLFLIKEEDHNDVKGSVIGLNSSYIVKAENQNLQIPILENGNFINQDLFIQNTDSLGLIAITLDNNKLLITANDEKQLNYTMQKYPDIISPNTAFILKDGQVIDYFNNSEKIKNMGNETKKIEYDIIIALVVLLSFTTIIFILHFKKVQ